MKRFDTAISRKHQARLVIAGPDNWRPVDDVLRIFKELNYSGRFRGERRHGVSETADYAFDLTWKQSSQAPPFKLMQALASVGTIISFEMIIAD